MGTVREYFKSQLEAARKARGGMSYRDLADAIGRDPTTVQRWGAGETAPSYEDLENVAKALGVPPSYFFPGGPIEVTAPTAEQALEVLARAIAQPDPLSAIPRDILAVLAALQKTKRPDVLARAHEALVDLLDASGVVQAPAEGQGESSKRAAKVNPKRS